MKNKHIAQSQWGAAHASTSVDFTQRTSQWQISPRLPWCAFVLSQNIRACMCFLRGGGKGKEKNGEMDEGSLGALGVLIIHRSVVGSELAISSWLYPCLMI